MRKLTVGDLFSGIGGFSLGLERTGGFETKWFVENDSFCQKVLTKHWPDVPKFGDINNFNLEKLWEEFVQNVKSQKLHQIDPIANPATLKECCNGKSTIGTGTGQPQGIGREEGRKKFSPITAENVLAVEKLHLNFSRLTINEIMEMQSAEHINPKLGRLLSSEDCLTTIKSSAITATMQNLIMEFAHIIGGMKVDVITAGVPCQPASVAGKRRGKADDRWLWPQAFRVIREFNPRWVILENVRGILSLEGGMVFEKLLAEMESYGYSVQPVIIPACAVNAPHRRDRVWIIGYAQHYGHLAAQERGYSHAGHSNSGDREQGQIGEIQDGKTTESTGSDCHASDSYDFGIRCNQRGQGQGESSRGSWDEDWYEVATRLCGTSHGFSAWLDYNWERIINESQKRITRQDLSGLWQNFQSETVQRDIGRCYPLLKTENLLAVVRKLQAESEASDGILFESEAIKENTVRAVRGGRESGHSPQRRKNPEQSPREHSDTLPPLSHEIALATESLVWWYECETDTTDRVHRLKALGNAVVPQIVEEIGKYILNLT